MCLPRQENDKTDETISHATDGHTVPLLKANIFDEHNYLNI